MIALLLPSGAKKSGSIYTGWAWFELPGVVVVVLSAIKIQFVWRDPGCGVVGPPPSAGTPSPTPPSSLPITTPSVTAAVSE